MLINSPVMCPHGAQLRKCEICERDQRIASLEAELNGADQFAADPAKWGLRARHEGVVGQLGLRDAEIANLVRALAAFRFTLPVEAVEGTPLPDGSQTWKVQDLFWLVVGPSRSTEAEARKAVVAINAVAEYLKPESLKE